MKIGQGLLGAVLFLAAVGLGQGVEAQVIGDGDCDDIFFNRQSEDPYGANSALNCTGQLANTHTLIYQSNVIRDIVGRRLITPPFAMNVSPAGLYYDSEAAARHVISGDGSIRIIPTADVPVEAEPVRNWNSWVDGKLSWIDPGDVISPTDGRMANFSGGVDYKLSDRVLIGLLVSYEQSDLDTTGFVSSTVDSNGLGGGAYIGITLSDNIVFSGMVTGTQLDTDSNFLGGIADIDSDRIQASGGLTGYWYYGQTRFSPSVTLAWSKEWQDDFVDSLGFFSPDQSTSTAVMTFGGQLGHTFSYDGGSVEPWVGAQFDWTFVNEVSTDGFGSYDLGDTYDLRVQTGMIWYLAPNAQLSLTGEISGLVMPDNNIYSGQANLAVQF
jgi:hypothetical protein